MLKMTIKALNRLKMYMSGPQIIKTASKKQRNDIDYINNHLQTLNMCSTDVDFKVKLDIKFKKCQRIIHFQNNT